MWIIVLLYKLSGDGLNMKEGWKLNQENRYYEVSIKNILENGKLSEDQKEVLQRYNKFKTNNGMGLNSRTTYLTALKMFCLAVNKEFAEVTKKDIEDYLYSIKDLAEQTKTFKKAILKNFFQWFYECEKGQYPEIVRWINVRSRKDKTMFRGKQDLLTPTEIEQLVNACNNLRDRAICMVMLEWGLRVFSIKNLSVKDVKTDGNGYLSLFVRGKGNVSGELTLFDSTPDLQAWLRVHKHKDNPDAPLFYAFKNKNGDRLVGNAIHAMISRTAKRAGIQKKVFPHLLRHIALTRKAKTYTDSELRVIALWRSNTMSKRYVHLDSEDIKKKEMERRGLLPVTQEEGTLKKLQTPLDMKSVMQKEREREEFFRRFDELAPMLRKYLNIPNPKKL